MISPPPPYTPEYIYVKSTTNATYNSSHLKWEGIIVTSRDSATVVKVQLDFGDRLINSSLTHGPLKKGESNVTIFIAVQMNETNNIEICLILFIQFLDLPAYAPFVYEGLITFVHDEDL